MFPLSSDYQSCLLDDDAQSCTYAFGERFQGAEGRICATRLDAELTIDMVS